MEKTELQKLVNANKHIPTVEIKQDILETQIEIEQMEKEVKHLAETPMEIKEARWNHIRADARKFSIKERKEFIEKLEAILDARKNSPKK